METKGTCFLKLWKLLPALYSCQPPIKLPRMWPFLVSNRLITGRSQSYYVDFKSRKRRALEPEKSLSKKISSKCHSSKDTGELEQKIPSGTAHMFWSPNRLVCSVSGLCAESFQLTERFCSQTVKYCSFATAHITHTSFMKAFQMELISFPVVYPQHETCFFSLPTL